MKKNKPEELREKTVDDLGEKCSSLHKELFNLRTKQKLGQLKNFSSLGLVKRDIARVETILGEKKRDEKKRKKEGKNRRSNKQ